MKLGTEKKKCYVYKEKQVTSLKTLNRAGDGG